MRGQEYGVRHFRVTEPQTLIDFLTDSLQGLVSKERVLELLDLGSIYVSGRRADPKDSPTVSIPLKIETSVRVHLQPRRFKSPVSLASRVTEQTKTYLIVDKPSGLPVHALVDNKKENLISFLESELGLKLYVTHRLDIDTTGLVILAKTPEAQTAINAKFQAGTVKRAYLALTEFKVQPGTYIHFMAESPKAPKTVSLIETQGSLRCELRVVACNIAVLTDHAVATTHVMSKTWPAVGNTPRTAFELEIELVTGRTHQIRAQLSSLGAPILGDSLYGSGFSFTDSSTGAAAIALWAFKIQTTPDEKILRPS